ncbi:MAG: alpha/beta hydrolase family protein [Candidatus Babeliales bacterium]
MNKKSLYLSSFFLFCVGTFTTTQARAAKLICLNDRAVQPTTVFLFAHGITRSSDTAIKQAQTYIESNIIMNTCYTFDFGDGLRTINLGQEPDCALFASAYAQVLEKHHDAHIILIGLSRGAVTILNTMALHPELDWQRTKGVILESPYANVSAMAEQIASSYMFFVPFKATIMRKLIDWLPSYKPDGIQPIEMISKIKVDVPFLIAYSEADKTVPAAGTRMLIDKLQSAGHRVTSWSCQKGKHSTLGSNAAFSQAAREFLSKQ